MTQALARATTLGASALLMGGAVLLALTMTYTIPDWDLATPPGPIEMTPEPAPPPPPAPQPLTQPLRELPDDFTPLPPMAPISPTAIATPYAGAVAPVGPIEVTRPRWLEQPRNLARYYPQRAIERSIEGDVVLNCLVRVSGLLDCEVVSENPIGWGFSQAALRIADAYRMAPATRAGAPVEGRYTMRVPFRID